MLGLMMEIAMFLMGIYNLFTDRLFGLMLIGIVILLWLIGFIWDKKEHGDYFYSWKQLKKLFKEEEN